MINENKNYSKKLGNFRKVKGEIDKQKERRTGRQLNIKRHKF